MHTNSDYVDKVLSRELKLYKLEEEVGDFEKACRIRHEFIKKKLGLDLTHIGKYSISPNNCKPNIENMMGAVQIPLGIAGPLKVNGEYAKDEFFLPLATTEGSLVASVNRGSAAINESGGANVVITKNCQTRALLFKTNGIKNTKRLISWVKSNFDDIKKAAESKSKYLELQDVETYSVGENVWLRLLADTKDAMGMNMITIAGDIVAALVESKFPEIEYVSVSGNVCIDKKPSALTLILGRGKSAIAEARLKRDVVKKYLKTTPEKLASVNYRKNLLGSAVSGSFGFNAHFANIIGAFYLATGQDIAHVVEGSHGITTMDVENEELYVTVSIPSIQVGALGGGTRVETQKEALHILGVNGSDGGRNGLKLAEITAAAVLAGELSLLAALSSQDLSKAHMKFNR